MAAGKSDRISIEMMLPSISLKVFVERALANDDFFAHALENPLGAFRDAGVRLDASSFIPSDFAGLFAALDRLKSAAKGEPSGTPTFEAIFGRPARIVGATLNAQVERGFFRDWGGREATTDQMKCFSASTSFEASAERQASSVQDLCQTQQVRLEMGTVGFQSRSAETDMAQDRDWAKQEATTERRSETQRDKNFGLSGQRTIGELLSGPLIHPEDLARLASRIHTFVDVLNETDKPG